eukprot:320949_1
MDIIAEDTHSFRPRLRRQSYGKCNINPDEKKEESLNNSSNNLSISVIPPNELTTFAKENNVSYDQVQSIKWCFTHYKYNSSFFGKATSDDKVRFMKRFSTLCKIRSEVAGALWMKCIQNNDNIINTNTNTNTLHETKTDNFPIAQLESMIRCFDKHNYVLSFFTHAKPIDKVRFRAILSRECDIGASIATALWSYFVNKVYAPDIKQEEDFDLDVSYLSALGSSPIKSQSKLDELRRINSFKDIAEHLVYNRWHKSMEGYYEIKYFTGDNIRNSICFYYKFPKPHDINYKSDWPGWFKFEGIWETNGMEKHVDIHIHVNVRSRETNVNIELYPDEYSDPWKKDHEDRLDDIGHKLNKYVCSEWITNNMIKQLNNMIKQKQKKN